MRRYLAGFFGCLTFLFGLQAWALHRAGGSLGKNESNFFSSVGRIQAGIRMDPEMMLLGSSLTGRFPDQSDGFAGVANLGCDGGSAADSLRAIDRGKLPGAPLLIVEGNTLYKAAGEPSSEVARAIEGGWFAIGRRIPALSAAARPSAFFYSALLERRIGRFPGEGVEPLTTAGLPNVPMEVSGLDGHERDLVDELSSVIGRLRDRGMRVEIVILPPGAPGDSPNILVARALAASAGVRFWDLTEGLPEGSVRLTDGVHMDRASAAATLLTLLQTLGLDSREEIGTRSSLRTGSGLDK